MPAMLAYAGCCAPLVGTGVGKAQIRQQQLVKKAAGMDHRFRCKVVYQEAQVSFAQSWNYG